MWGLAAEWLHASAEIPDDPELETDLTAPQYGFSTGFSSKQTNPAGRKNDMKSRGCASPAMGDVLAMSFAVKVRSASCACAAADLFVPGRAFATLDALMLTRLRFRKSGSRR